MKSFAVVFVLSVCCLFVAIDSRVAQPKLAGLQMDNTESSITETELPTHRDCLQPSQAGICFGYIPRFAYNAEERECVQFIYGGCLGNDNNFDTQAACKEKCMNEEQNSPENQAQTTVSANSEDDTTTAPSVSL